MEDRRKMGEFDWLGAVEEVVIREDGTVLSTGRQIGSISRDTLNGTVLISVPCVAELNQGRAAIRFYENPRMATLPVKGNKLDCG